MIITKIQGGLGNQMFQYALGRSLAIKNSVKLFLDIDWYQSLEEKSGTTIRSFDLPKFRNVSIELMDAASVIQPVVRHKKRLFNNFTKRMASVFHEQVQIYKEPFFEFDANVFSFRNNVYLDGYWQSEKYFKDIRESLLRDFSFGKPELPSETEKKIVTGNSVSIHFRRGDFANDPQINSFHGVLSKSYYLRAIDIILQKTVNPIFFVFSDDIEWVQKNFPHSGVELNYVSSANFTPIDEMRLMSLCKHNIVANSSFSWWGAWLNTSPDKIVVAPERWVKNENLNTTDVVPEKWIKIEPTYI